MKKPLQGLTGLRALACLSVVVYHLNQQRPIENLSKLDWDFYQFVAMFPVTVSFFFILGGMLRSVPYWKSIFWNEKAPTAKKALADRFFRIAPAYYAALLVSLVAVFFVQGGMENAIPRTLAAFTFLSWAHPSTFFPVDLNGPLWYVSYDVMGGLAVIAVMTALTKLPKKAAWWWMLAAAGVLLALHEAFIRLPFPQSNGILWVWFPTYNPFLFGLHFLLWMALWGLSVKAEMAGLKPAWKFDFAFVALTVGIFWYLWDIRGASDFEDSWPTGPYRFPLVPMVLAGIIFSAEYSKQVGIWLDNRLFSAIAKVSFSVYLFHALIIAVLRKTVFPGSSISFENWLWLVAVTLPLSFLFGWIGYELVEKRASEKLRKTFMKNE